ncbi:MAG TPA: hypothetical protein VMW27_05605 [Thermoanaerobaculia bacterium]|nr:hypothetical protein [Thermoanaerobaculia bacterium]
MKKTQKKEQKARVEVKEVQDKDLECCRASGQLACIACACETQ